MEWWFIKLGIGLFMACAMLFNYGYGLTLPSYNRRKWLRGESVYNQQHVNKVAGEFLMRAVSLIAIIITLLHFIIGFLMPVKYEYSKPKTVEIWHSMDQGKAVLMIDGELIEKDHTEVPYYITKDCNCFYYSRGVGMYGSSAFISKYFHVYIPEGGEE